MGVWHSDPDSVVSFIQNHFESFFQVYQCQGIEDVLSVVELVVTDDMNAKIRPIKMEEVRKAVLSLRKLKAPGLDGFPGAFFQKHWELVSKDVYMAVKEFFKTGVLLAFVNETIYCFSA